MADEAKAPTAADAATPPAEKCTRIWRQKKSTQLFERVKQYCESHSKLLETLQVEDFKAIAKEFGQTPLSCLKKTKEILMCGTVKAGVWCAAEDELLFSCIQDGLDWKEVASRLNSIIYSGVKVRTSKHCKERWGNHLDPSIDRGPWNSQEDLAVFEGFKRHRTAWSQIASELGNRTGTAVKNRFYSLIRKEQQLYGESDVDEHVDRVIMRLCTKYCSFEFNVDYL